MLHESVSSRWQHVIWLVLGTRFWSAHTLQQKFKINYKIRERKVKTLTRNISGKSFHFPFPSFVIFVLRYFPFHVVCFVYLHVFSFLLCQFLYVLSCPWIYPFSNSIKKISGKSFHFPFPYFVIFVLRYFPFHMVFKNKLMRFGINYNKKGQIVVFNRELVSF